ncbi:MAG TPA: zf-HC2 domain-containing protein [Candidatus Bathyarchaeia archaeon]|nr:zf-HC2 domain-containing protein [Candidatus Bathyarchaeia archaeon]
MSVRGGRPRRPDAWSDAHTRARFRAAERLQGPLDPTESAWLDDHLQTCPECRAAAAAYAAQRLELRSLADRQPVPPRDLWARTAAAIERESAFRDRAGGRRGRRSLLAPYALLSAALVVAVVIGTLTSSRLFPDGGAAASPLSGGPSAGDQGPLGSVPGATPVILPGNKVEWISQDSNGDYQIVNTVVDQVCPAAATPCPTTAPTEQRPVDLNGDAKTVIGSPNGDQIVVFGDNGTPQTGNVSVTKIPPTPGPGVSPSPSDAGQPTPPVTAPPPTVPPPTVPPATPTIRPTATPTSHPTVSPSPPLVASSTPPASEPPIATPSVTPSVDVTPSASPDGTVQIAHNVIVVGQAASYSPSGAWFAFTARPSDGSAGPDIYLWRVGDAQAHPITTDHRSELGGWNGDIIVGSTAIDTPDGAVGGAFLIDPVTGRQTLLPQAGNAWRPSVDPFDRQAVYWTGRLRPTTDGPGFAPDTGRLVIGTWGATTSAPSDGPSPTAPADQPNDRNETTIVAGQLSDWDARWDETGTRLAIWIASASDPSVGQLSLYAVDQFDGRIDLKKPLVDGRTAKAGYAISQGKLVWAEPAPNGGSGDGRILVFAWTDKGSGEVEGVPGKVIVIR